MHPYTPTTGVFHPTIDLIDDSDAPTATNFNVAPGSVADNAAYNKAQDDIFHPQAGNAYTNVHNAQYMLRKLYTANVTPPAGTTLSSGSAVTGSFALFSTSSAGVLAGDVVEYSLYVPIFIVDSTAADPYFFNAEVVAVVGGASSAPSNLRYSNFNPTPGPSTFEQWLTLPTTGFVVAPASNNTVSLSLNWEFLASTSGSIGFRPALSPPGFAIPFLGPQVVVRIWTPVV